MKTSAKIAIAAAATVTLVGLLVLANYVAGVMLFLSYKESPARAHFSTIQQSWAAAETPAQKKKVKVSALLALLVCLGGPGMVLQTILRTKPPALYGNARFANRAELRKEGLHQDQGIVLGKSGGELLRLPGYEFVLLAAPTRTGKGVGFCIPNLLMFTDSAVVLDIKGENYNLTSAYRSQRLGHEVFYFNPFSETTCRWNPLSYVSVHANFRVNDLIALAAIIYPPNTKDPFWPESARNLFVGVALLVLETPRLPHTLGEVLRQGSGKGRDPAEYLRHIIASRESMGAPLSSSCVDCLNRFLNNPENTLKNILSSFGAPLAIWSNPVLDKATSTDDFDLRDVRKRRMTIYLHIPASEILQAGFILNMFFSQLINENVRELPEDNPDLRYPCLLLMDEFTSMGKVEIIAKGIGYIASYNLRLAIIIQDRSQIESTYGKEDAHNIISNMGAMILFTPSQVREAEEYSKLIGTQTLKTSSRQRSNSSGKGGGTSGTSLTDQQHARAVMLPQELLGMDRSKQLIVRAGIPVIHADKIRFFDDPKFQSCLNEMAARDVKVQETLRRVPLPLQLPRKNWRIFHQALDRSGYYLQDDFSDLVPTMASDESSLLDQINQDAQTMTDESLDAMCLNLARAKVAAYAELFAIDSGLKG